LAQSQPPPQPDGWPAALLNWVAGLTWRNVLVVLGLVLIAIPAYIAYRALNDPVIMDRLMSQYREVKTATPCLLREVKERGGADTWGISQGFAYFGNERWTISVLLNHQPTLEEIASHCEVLTLTVDWMRDPAEHEIPKIPGTNDPLIWQYPLEDGGFHRDGP